jgi:hypothetical protein
MTSSFYSGSRAYRDIAEQSAENAAASEAAAELSAAGAANSALQAANSAASASASAGSAAVAQGAAETAQGAAETAETNAAGYVAQCSAEKDAAQIHAGNAAASALTAENALADIGTALTDAEAAAIIAEAWAEYAEDVPVEPGRFSALHWAAKAAGYLAEFGIVYTPVDPHEIVDDYLMVSGAGSTVTINKAHLVSTGAGYTINLPVPTTTGEWVHFQFDGDVNSTNITLDGGDLTIAGDETLIVDVSYARLTLVYNGTEWKV